MWVILLNEPFMKMGINLDWPWVRGNLDWSYQCPTENRMMLVMAENALKMPRV
jgi:hypothetical protein